MQTALQNGLGKWFGMLSNEDIKILEASAQDASIFTRYYFGVDMLPHQIVMAHATQKTLLTLGGRGSGKTFGYMLAGIWMATTMPDFAMLWTSYTGEQAAIAFNDIRPLILGSERFRKFLPEGERSLKKKPYPSIHIKLPGYPESVIRFMPVDANNSGDTKRGFSWDWIHIDEGGLIYDEKVISGLRPSLRGRRNVVGRPPRLGRISTSTTPTSASWLKDWWLSANDPSYPGYDDKKYAAIRVSSYQNTTLTDEQLENFQLDMTAEERQVEIEGDFPEYIGNEFSPAIVDACQDVMLNKEIEELIEQEIPDVQLKSAGKVGTVVYQRGSLPNHHYVLVGDPGTGNPPYRNAGVIVVFDVTKLPYELVYFHWVSGNGDYRPFFNSFEWAYRYYRPIYTAFDATGTQRAMDQLYFEDRGLIVEGLAVTTEKPAMINSLKILLQKKMLRFPLIQGLRLQLLNYRQDQDKKLAQDIVMALSMAAWRIRALFYTDADSVGPGDDLDTEMFGREMREENRIFGRR